jgi:hypothetical protein
VLLPFLLLFLLFLFRPIVVSDFNKWCLHLQT